MVISLALLRQGYEGQVYSAHWCGRLSGDRIAEKKAGVDGNLSSKNHFFIIITMAGSETSFGVLADSPTRSMIRPGTVIFYSETSVDSNGEVLYYVHSLYD